ncbi:helix-turn-helix transcriptional regulator [Lapidilactobacillus bayanensis]|uniref:helix-turn-helix transcriptional regulator n=1 Tax=Lapidilactobacillus bayanensis TaxID=2485998 RepID=UPI000F79D1D3|nr:helix-turn-helix transcriptional regulator [Lapidilactobacillus bayanensis]
MSLGDKIKENRAKLSLTQEELGRELHVSRQTISNWEVGRSYPDIESLILLSDYFNLSLDKLLREDTKMVSSLKKRSISETIYVLLIACPNIGGLTSIIVDLAINKQLTWSQIVLSSCLFLLTFLIAFKQTKNYHLLKASFAAGIPLFLLFFSVKNNTRDLDFALLLKISVLWFLSYLLLVYLIERSKLPFWNILIVIMLVSFPLEAITRMLTHENLLGFAALLSNFFNLLITGAIVFAYQTNLDKGLLNHLLTNYRQYTQTRK